MNCCIGSIGGGGVRACIGYGVGGRIGGGDDVRRWNEFCGWTGWGDNIGVRVEVEVDSLGVSS